MNFDPCALLEPAIKLAARAGEKIMAVYGTDFRVTKKYDASPVTEADRLSDQLIQKGLAKLTPDIAILSEETEHLAFAQRKNMRHVWLVDPLDGTREFIKRNGEFTVNIALIEDHVPVLGIVYAPVSETCYYACRGLGAFKRIGRGKSVAIRSKKYDATRPMVVTGSRSNVSAEVLRDLFARIGPIKYVPMGSALKSCVVAEGGADLYPRFGPTGEWDTAAAQCIVEEAGGGFVGLDLKPLRYNARETLLNPHFLVYGDPVHRWDKLLNG